MNNKSLGCLTTGGIITLAITLLSVGVSYSLTKNQIFSPGELSGLSSGQQFGEIDSHADLKQDCQSCHEDIQTQLSDIRSLHGMIMYDLSSEDCRPCHTDHLGTAANLTTYDVNDFPHDLVFFSLQAHLQVDWVRDISCQDCHPTSYRNFDPMVCSDCHLEYDQQFTNKHIHTYDLKCTACHDGVESINKDFDHTLAAFQLSGKHQEVLCEDCHFGATDLLMFKSAPQLCLACHQEQDVHENSLGTLCEKCHTPSGWTQAFYDHNLTGFILDGGHTDLSCDSCHPDPTFQGLNPDCISCHLEDDLHKNQLGTDCTFCHSTVSWSDTHFDHEGPFAENCGLCHRGDSPVPHYLGQCSACHITSAWLPATFNHSVAQATDCLSCHDIDRPANHFSGQCSICHSTTGWKPANINHTFPITHRGAEGVCNNCHDPNNYPAYTCYKCHEHSRSEVKKEHEGVNDLDNCVRCHWDGREHGDGGGD
jgi:hypothetical protein